MKIAISGSHGFIAKHLIKSLQLSNHQIVSLDRELFKPDNRKLLIDTLETCDAIINLAGASINTRWTKKNKSTIYDSRIQTTRILVSTINELTKKPAVFVSASAVGAYPADTVGDENDTRFGDTFLATVCHDWEAEANKISDEVRLVVTRFGVVLSADGGAFPKMAIPYRLKMGGKIGSGSQGFSWIHIYDLIKSIQFLLDNKLATGVFNLTSPQKTSNLLLTLTLCKYLKSPSLFTLPVKLLRILLGEQSQLLTDGQYIFPIKLLQLGFVFRYPTIDKAITEIIRNY